MITFSRFLPACWALVLGATPLLAQAGSEDSHSRTKSADSQFIQDEVAAGEALSLIAQEAASYGERAAVRAFARILAYYSEKSNADLFRLATSKEVELASINRAERLVSIREEKGESFDREFVALMIEMHEQSVENFERAASESTDIEIKSWATGMLPGLKAQLKRAKELRSAETASSGKLTTITL